MNFTTGQIVRTYPDRIDGNFCVYRVTGSIPSCNLLELTELQPNAGITGLLARPDTLELYETENTFGTIRIGDKVHCMGLEGEHTLLGFFESFADGELKGIVSRGGDGRGSIPWVIEYIKKA